MSAIQSKFPAAQAIFNDAETMANETLQQAHLESSLDASPSHSAIHHYHYWRDPFWFWTPRQTVLVNCEHKGPVPASSREKKNGKNSDAFLIAAAAAVVFMTASWFLAGNARELKNLNRKRDELDFRQALTQDEGSAEAMEPVVKRLNRLIVCQKEESKIGLFLKGGILVSAAAAGIGAFASPILLSAGILAGIASGAATILHSGYKEGDTTQKQEADRLLASIAQARQALEKTS